MFEIYTDGSSLKNGQKDNKGAYAVIVYRDGELYDAYYHEEYNTTNNRQEMKAILYAMINYGKYKPVIFCDSAYAINSFDTWRKSWKNNGWRKANGDEILNLDLIQAYDELDRLGFSGNLIKVRGHRDNEGNNLADALATGRIKVGDIINGNDF